MFFLPSLFKKKKKDAQVILPQTPSLENMAAHILKTKGLQIQEGLARPTASTGTPIDELYGGAKKMAQMSNIGGGSKATGGGGVDEGLNALIQFTQAQTVKKMLETDKKKKKPGREK